MGNLKCINKNRDPVYFMQTSSIKYQDKDITRDRLFSFIIIGRNEEQNLARCILGITETIRETRIESFEILYVDSASSDNSVRIAMDHSSVRVYYITGGYNAAVARNIGAFESKGEWLVFVDGDMKLAPGFLNSVLSSKERHFSYYSGQLENCILDRDGTIIKKSLVFKNLVSSRVEISTGGVFIIKRDAWEMVGGMDSRLKRTQDIDLGLRLHKKGIELLRLPGIIATHYSIAYENNPDLLSPFKRHLYTGVLWRKHFFEKAFYRRFLRIYITTVILGLTIISVPAVASRNSFLIPFSVYFITLVIYSGLKSIYRKSGFIKLLSFYLQQDISVYSGLLFCFPGEIQPKYYEVEKS